MGLFDETSGQERADEGPRILSTQVDGDPVEAVDLAVSSHEPVIVEPNGSALAAVIPIDLFERCSASAANAPSLIHELLAISGSVPEEEWAKLPEDGAENIDRYLHGTQS